MNITPSLDIILGSMYSGKSTELIRRLGIYAEMGLDVLYVNSHLDTRTDVDFSTHNPSINNLGKIESQKLEKLDDLLETNHKIIGIDEGQMFENLKQIILNLVEVGNKKVIIVGLDGDFERKKFGEIIDLIPYCDTITKLNSFCEICCQKYNKIEPALFTHRINDEKEKIIIGRKEIYVPLCRKCYLMENNPDS